MNISPDIKYFRCITCNTFPCSINEIAPLKDRPIIEFHNECKLELMTRERYNQFMIDEEFKKITKNNNAYKYSLRWFLHKARIINRMGIDFTMKDFPELEPANFRQKIFIAKQKGFVEKTDDGIVASYRIIGEQTGKNRAKVTREGMGVGVDFEEILRDVCISYPKIHDIKIKIDNDELYQILKKTHPIDKSNGRINGSVYPLKPYTFATVSVYPNTIQIDISCSRMPIIYDTNGAIEFLSYLNELRWILMTKARYQAHIPSVLDWVVTHYHFNKDGMGKQYSGQRFEVKVKEMSTGLIRFYSKLFPDGITRARLEQIRSPKSKVIDEITKMVMTDNYVNNKLGIKLAHEDARTILDIQPESERSECKNLLNVVIVNEKDMMYNSINGVFSF